jgi:hypothetical protein
VDGNPSDNISINDRLKVDSVNTVADRNKDLARTNPTEFVKQCHKEFCRQKLSAFPMYCEIARVQNALKWQELNQSSNKGKYTDSMGWSQDGTMRFQFEIPQELYHFMQNLIYEGFWEKHNKKIADKFMNRICKGSDPNELLVWVRSIYGGDMGKVINHGM